MSTDFEAKAREIVNAWHGGLTHDVIREVHDRDTHLCLGTLQRAIASALREAASVPEGKVKLREFFKLNLFAVNPVTSKVVACGPIGIELYEDSDAAEYIVTLRDEDGDEFEVFDHECYETREAAEAARAGT